MKNIQNFKFILAFIFAVSLFSCNNAPKKEEAKTDAIPAVNPPMTVVMVKHSVADFSKWMAAFNAHDSVRKSYGLSVISVSRGLDDTNVVAIALKADDLQKAKDFAGSANLKEVMQNAGVTSAPEISYANVIRNDNSKISQTNRLMVAHHVKDFNAWLKVYDGEGIAKRTEEGIVDRALARGVEDTNMVYIIFALNDRAKATAAFNSDAKKKLMTDAGVDGPPTIFFYNLNFLQE